MASVPQLQRAIADARPGDIIEVASGTYSSKLLFRSSGTSSAPITLRPAPGAKVTLRANLKAPSCGATGPDPDRTLTFQRGASHWNLQGLTIDGGVMISSENAQYAQAWFAKKIKAGDWSARRKVPGRAPNTAAAAPNAAAYLSGMVHHQIKQSTGISLINNTITRKGVHSRFASNGVLQGNTIRDISCGTGPAVWLALYSDRWRVEDNTVSRVARSAAGHWMQEGIRIGGASSYNVVRDNTVTDLPTGGRAFTTDQDASYNTITSNRAARVDIAFNEQMSGWQNKWTNNVANSTRVAAFSFRAMDGRLRAPSMNSSPNGALIRCNVTDGSATDFQAGALMNSAIEANTFSDVFLSQHLKGYFASKDNTWNGHSRLPGVMDSAPDRGTCPSV